MSGFSSEESKKACLEFLEELYEIEDELSEAIKSDDEGEDSSHIDELRSKLKDKMKEAVAKGIFPDYGDDDDDDGEAGARVKGGGPNDSSGSGAKEIPKEEDEEESTGMSLSQRELADLLASAGH